jgi:hypothetical protein
MSKGLQGALIVDAGEDGVVSAVDAPFAQTFEKVFGALSTYTDLCRRIRDTRDTRTVVKSRHVDSADWEHITVLGTPFTILESWYIALFAQVRIAPKREFSYMEQATSELIKEICSTVKKLSPHIPRR